MPLFRSRQLPRTSYGYQPPAGAVVVGWHCTTPYESACDSGCGYQGDEIPRRWPFPCLKCGGPTDPVFAQPWQHVAKGGELQYLLAQGVDDDGITEFQWIMWRHKEARRIGDRQAAAEARRDFRAIDASGSDEDPFRTIGYFTLVWEALEVGDLDSAADDILHWFDVSTSEDVRDDGGSRRNNCCRVIESAIRLVDTLGAERNEQAVRVRQTCLEFAAGVYEVLPRDLQSDVTRLSRT